MIICYIFRLQCDDSFRSKFILFTSLQWDDFHKQKSWDIDMFHKLKKTELFAPHKHKREKVM